MLALCLARNRNINLPIETLTYQSFFSKVNADGTAILPVEIVRGVANQKARLAHAGVANGQKLEGIVIVNFATHLLFSFLFTNSDVFISAKSSLIQIDFLRISTRVPYHTGGDILVIKKPREFG